MGALPAACARWGADPGPGPGGDAAGRSAGGAVGRFLAIVRGRGLPDALPGSPAARPAWLPARAVGRAAGDDGGAVAVEPVVLRRGVPGWRPVEPHCGAVRQLRDRALRAAGHAAAPAGAMGGRTRAEAGRHPRACPVVAARADGELARRALVPARGGAVGVAA